VVGANHFSSTVFSLALARYFFEKSKPVGFLKKKRRERGDYVPERTKKL
jgi:hypothetical protein